MQHLRRISRLALSIVAGTALLACTPSQSVPAPAVRPSLVVFITVDQMQPSYFTRYASQLQGGFTRLLEGGAVFTNAHHDHGITETAPGHASLMSGRFPRSTGITRNLRGVNDTSVRLIGARDLAASPFRFRGTTLTDWITAVEPDMRVLSVSAKDRGAILPVGRSRQNVYWFANNGIFTTSTWYRDTLPSWVRAFNARRIPQSYMGKAWMPLLDRSAYPEADTVQFEFTAAKESAFPHRIPANDTLVAMNRYRYSPLMDEVTAAFALEGLRNLDIGRGPTTDILAVSFSATDYVGHRYGPESMEQRDQIIRLDRVLGAFIDTLYQLRDSSRIIFALSADHGGSPIPELHNRVRVQIRPAMTAARAVVTQARGDTTALDVESGAFFVDSVKLGTNAISVDSIVSAFMAAAIKIPGVERVDRFRDLRQRNLERDYVARRWLQMFPADMEPAAVVTLGRGNMYDYGVAATHGSPHMQDSHVPMIFYGPPFVPGRYNQFVRTVDIGPTLARALGVTPTEPLDGRPLTDALRRAR